MAIKDLIHNGVAIADRLTQSLQPTVQHHRFVEPGRYDPEMAGPVPRKAIVEWETEMVRMHDGREENSIAKLHFLRPVEVGAHDTFTMPDGETYPVLRPGGLLDEDGVAVVTTVRLGSLVARQS